MDSIQISILIAEIAAQMARVTAINQMVESRAALLEKEQITAVEALAYQLHTFYNACEDLLQDDVAHFVSHLRTLL